MLRVAVLIASLLAADVAAAAALPQSDGTFKARLKGQA